MFSESEGEIKAFPGKQRSTEFMTTRIVFRQCSRELRVVVDACSPSYPGGRGRRVVSLRLVCAKVNKTLSQNKRSWGTAKGWSICSARTKTWFQPPVQKKSFGETKGH
jgi:hypothetical protein